MDPLFDLPALLRAIWERLPRRVWLALGLAILTFVVEVRAGHLGHPGVPFDPLLLLNSLVPSLYGLLAAAALWMGSRNWHSGRRSAEWTGVLFLAAGLVELARRVMLDNGIMTTPDAAFDPLLLCSLLSALALVGAGGLLAHGLWQGHRPIATSGMFVLLGLAILGLMGGSLIIAATVHVTTFPNVEITAWTWPLVILHSAWVLSLAAVTGSALVRPWRFRVAQAAVASGALGLAIADTAQNALVWFTQGNSPTPLWTQEAYGVLTGVSVVCLLLLVAGLFASTEGEPAAMEAAEA